jgi:hypothetical protein
VSPIFVRPVREQLEHDRLIRHLVLKYKRKFDVATNIGEEQLAPVKIGSLTLYPDLVLTSGRKLAGMVEVESGESVNNLEAMAQWVHFSRSRVPFHLYVPVTSYETARRLCEANDAQVSEIWTYRPAADGFDLVKVSADAGGRSTRPAREVAATPKPARPPVKSPAPPPSTAKARPKPAKPPAKNGKPASKAKERPNARAAKSAVKKTTVQRAKGKASGSRRK